MTANALIKREKSLDAARGYLMLEMTDHALRELDAIADPHKCPFQINLMRGEALRQKKDYIAALQAFQRSQAERPDDLSARLGMAWCYKRSDQLPKAIAAMKEAYRTHRTEPIVLYNLACYLALAGEKEQALSWLGRSLRMQPSLRKLIPDESDFDRLRHDPDFQLVVGEPGSVSKA